ncbi:hypothetical protein TNCT_434671 [Trichonephila clavata]|uniref:Uncharacterized protein n=1 Tax=Trichonephila clavata TaxID=2740835 RepID=A0A8X6J1P0_TRICU|nr:hypothetical protein TNCT_434671 [Trichonephila clavata]
MIKKLELAYCTGSTAFTNSVVWSPNQDVLYESICRGDNRCGDIKKKQDLSIKQKLANTADHSKMRTA